MTRLHELEKHRQSLGEIREILNSMKTLAYMETRKLSRFLGAQQAVVDSIEEAAADLLSFYPDVLPRDLPGRVVCVIVGSERGFCGDFNHALLRALQDWTAQHPAHRPALLVVGHKLAMLLERDEQLVAAVGGASVVEEVFDLLSQLVAQLKQLQARNGGLTVYGLYHNGDAVVMKRLLPPFQAVPGRPSRWGFPPETNVDPRRLLADLSEHYLFGALHLMVYTSLMAENRTRLSHLEGAVNHLDEELQDLGRRYNALRQEQITEEIEVILLGVDDLSSGGP